MKAKILMKGYNMKQIILNVLTSEFTLDKYLNYTNRRLLYLARLQGQASELTVGYTRNKKEPKNSVSAATVHVGPEQDERRANSLSFE
jgi:hypothetical protein